MAVVKTTKFVTTALFRYTILVRRNFLRFGKRSGGPVLHGEEEEREEEERRIEEFLSQVGLTQHTFARMNITH